VGNHDYDPHDLDGQLSRRDDKDRRLAVLTENEKADLKWLLNSRQGRRIAWRFVEGARRLSFSLNAQETAFKEGERNRANLILSWIEDEHTEAYALMLQERADDRRRVADSRNQNRSRSTGGAASKG
jgi:hypothetical protein